MGNLAPKLRLLCAMAFAVALCLAPLVAAFTHGPAVVAAELEHAAFHAQKADQVANNGAGHDHHSALDHDHSAPFYWAQDAAMILYPALSAHADHALLRKDAAPPRWLRPPKHLLV